MFTDYGETVWSFAKGFFIFMATGTDDFAYDAFKQQVMHMGHYFTDSMEEMGI